MMNMILGLAAAAAMAGAAPSPAQGADGAAFEALMARGDGHRAAHVVDDMILARRRAAPPMGADPLLNGLLGRVTLASGHALAALGYLEHADGPAVPERQRVAAHLALAAAREQVGDFGGAGQALDRLAGETLTASESEAAILARGRLLLPTDPAAAIRVVAPLAASEWEAATIVAQAQSLLGNAAAAREAADRAWAAAPAAPPQAYAPLRVALVRAALAAAAGDRPALLAMLNAGATAGSDVASNLADFLPICGEHGIVAGDAVSFALFEDSNGTDELRPVAATRVAAVKPFLDALAGRDLLQHAGDGPGGTLITVRCRSFVDGDYDAPWRSADPWIAFLARYGLYGTIARDGSLDDINALSSELESMARAMGEDDPRLIPLRVQLAQWLDLRARSEGGVEAWQIAELQRKAASAVAKLGGGEEVYLSAEDLAANRAMEKAATPDEAMRLFRAALLRRAATLPLDSAYAQTNAWLGSDKEATTEAKSRAIETLLQRFGAKSSDPRRRALLMRLGGLEKEADVKAARASWAAAGLPADLCAALDEPPHVRDARIADEDYPSDTLQFGIEGKSVFEAAIGPTGQVAEWRLLLATPSLLFDPVVAAKLPGFEISPPTSAGRPRSCRGYIQTIRWKMPDRDSDDESPVTPPFHSPEASST